MTVIIFLKFLFFFVKVKIKMSAPIEDKNIQVFGGAAVYSLMTLFGSKSEGSRRIYDKILPVGQIFYKLFRNVCLCIWIEQPKKMFLFFVSLFSGEKRDFCGWVGKVANIQFWQHFQKLL